MSNDIKTVQDVFDYLYSVDMRLERRIDELKTFPDHSDSIKEIKELSDERATVKRVYGKFFEWCLVNSTTTIEAAKRHRIDIGKTPNNFA
jgi:hypothetical protein